MKKTRSITPWHAGKNFLYCASALALLGGSAVLLGSAQSAPVFASTVASSDTAVATGDISGTLTNLYFADNLGNPTNGMDFSTVSFTDENGEDVEIDDIEVSGNTFTGTYGIGVVSGDTETFSTIGDVTGTLVNGKWTFDFTRNITASATGVFTGNLENASYYLNNSQTQGQTNGQNFDYADFSTDTDNISVELTGTTKDNSFSGTYLLSNDATDSYINGGKATGILENGHWSFNLADPTQEEASLSGLKDITIYTDSPTYNPFTNSILGGTSTDTSGQQVAQLNNGVWIPFSEIKVSNPVNMQKTGVYPVTFSYSLQGVSYTSTSKVTVAIDHGKITAPSTATAALGAAYNFTKGLTVTKVDGIVKTGKNVNTWLPNFFYNEIQDYWTLVDIKDPSGKEVTAAANQEKVQTFTPTKVGVYTIKYSVWSPTGKDRTATTKLTVKNYTALNIKNVTIPMNTPWSNSKAFVSATNASNAKVALSSVKVTGTVNPKKAGTYKLTYSYGGIKKVATITVKNYTSLNVKATYTLKKGTKWSNSKAFVSATNASNSKVSFSSVKVKGTVNYKKAGKYSLTYSYGGITKKVVVTVK